MKKNRLFIVTLGLVFGLGTVQAQNVGINDDNSNPDPSAVLDVKSNNKGLLIPRLTLAQRNAILAPATGLMIYQTDNTSGFYYNSGTPASPVWTSIGAGSWGLTGNNILSGQFLGTTNAIGLDIRTNNVSRAFITNDGLVGIGTTAPTHTLDVDGQIRIRGGSPAAGRILVSDANGVGTWQNAPSTGWSLTGNAVTAGQFLGSTNNQALNFRTNNNTRFTLYNDGAAEFFTNGFFKINNNGNAVIRTDNNINAGNCIGFWRDPEANHRLVVNGLSINGTSYTTGGTYAGIHSQSGNGAYNFGVAGIGVPFINRNGGVYGAVFSTTWGILGYTASNGILYGAYFSGGTANGAGYAPQGQNKMAIGLGVHGELMGAWVKGELGGLTTSGELYAAYHQGNVYTEGFQADLVKEGNQGNLLPAYANTSTSLKVYADGMESLNGSETFVAFEPAFLALIAKDKKPVVTVTAVGAPVSLYLKRIEANGFVVASVDGKANQVDFAWTAVAKRRDAERAQAPEQLINPEFSNNLPKVMFNENNTERSAKPMWWDGQRFQYSPPPVPKDLKKG